MTRNNLKNNTSMNLILKDGSQNKKCTEVEVDFGNNYIEKFNKKIHHLYSKSRFYEEIKSTILDSTIIEKQFSVSEFNIELIKKICYFLDINTKIIDTSVGMTDKKKGEGLKEITKKLGGTTYINAIGGQSLYNKDDFKKSDIDLFFIKMGDIDVQNKYASILDLLFSYPKEHIKKQLTNYTLI
jgi:hypothetical protein